MISKQFLISTFILLFSALYPESFLKLAEENDRALITEYDSFWSQEQEADYPIDVNSLTVSQPPLDAAVSNEPHYNYLIYTDHEPCGYLRYAITENDACLESLYLEPSFRGKGIGTEALKQLEHLLLKQGVKRLSLTVLEKNIPGINLYEKMGFEIRKHFVENCFSGIYMQKQL